MSVQTKQQAETPTLEDLMNYLYPKTFTCPVCNKEFMDFLVRKSKLRQVEVSRDFRVIYQDIDPNLYEVTLCSHCGYAALSNYFDRINSRQQDLITEKICPTYKHIEVDIPLTKANALARYKQALTCAAAMGAKSSTKSIICLKMSWIYRDAKDERGELTLLKLAYAGLKEAYTTESFPLGTMDEATAKYMIAEMARRLGDFDEALKMIGDVIVSRNTPGNIRNRAQDLKELIREKISTV